MSTESTAEALAAMSPDELIAAANAHGLKVFTNGKTVKITPTDWVMVRIIAAIRDNEPAIIAALNAKETARLDADAGIVTLMSAADYVDEVIGHFYPGDRRLTTPAPRTAPNQRT